MKYTTRNTLYLLLFALFLILFATRLVQDGMFIDGVYYAALANNLAQGIGSFWALKFSEGIFSVFYEHPPLMPGIQSLFFKVLGSGYGTERWYCGIVSLLTLLGMARIWKRVFKDQAIAQWWPLPLLFWMLNEDAYLSYTANMLECTMTLFDLGAVGLLLCAYPLSPSGKSPIQQPLYLVGAGTLLVAAFLTKGPAGLFPLAYFGIVWWSHRSLAGGQMLVGTVLLTAITVGGIAALFWYEPAKTMLSAYFEQQVFAALQGKRLENIAPHRLYMLQRFLETHLHWLLLLLVLWWRIIWHKGREIAKIQTQSVLFFAGMGAAALLPVMISPKQAPHYIVPALPWMALAIGGSCSAILWPLKAVAFPRWAMVASIFLVLAGCVLMVSKIGKVRDDLASIQPVFEVVPAGIPIGFVEKEEALVKNGYFQRYRQNSIDSRHFHYDYLVIEKGVGVPEGALVDYNLINDRVGKFQVFRKR